MFFNFAKPAFSNRNPIQGEEEHRGDDEEEDGVEYFHAPRPYTRRLIPVKANRQFWQLAHGQFSFASAARLAAYEAAASASASLLSDEAVALAETWPEPSPHDATPTAVCV